MCVWIFERDSSPTGLPIARLIQRLTGRFPGAACEIRRCEGYGAQVNAWGAEGPIRVDLASLAEVASAGEEWFYELEAQLPGVRFGVHDSARGGGQPPLAPWSRGPAWRGGGGRAKSSGQPAGAPCV